MRALSLLPCHPKRLRIANGLTILTVASGNIMASPIRIGEKAAEIIAGDDRERVAA